MTIRQMFFFRHMTEKMNISGDHVLVIGTEQPWLEALILEAGARKVTTLGKSKNYCTKKGLIWLIFNISIFLSISYCKKCNH